MGNQQSTGAKKGDNENPNFLAEYVNEIASKLIREQNFHDMKNLFDSKKCDNLVIITADIFEKYFTGNQVTYLDHRIKDGIVDNNEETALKEENVLYFEKDNLKHVDIDTNKETGKTGFKKRRICIGLAKYYIKIAHLFAAIRTTINEDLIKEERQHRSKREYRGDEEYRDDEEDMYDDYKYEEYYDKYYGGGYDSYKRLSVCGRRLMSLLHKKKTKKGDYLAPEFCSSEYRNRIKTLDDELGIPELEALYNNQYEYDESKRDWKKQFTGRDKKMDEEYKKDLTELYNQMTQSTGKLPKEIRDYTDIPVGMEGNPQCSRSTGYKTLRNHFLIKRGDQEIENEFLSEYMANIKKMEDEVEKKNLELIEILKSLFKKKSDEDKGEGAYKIVIDPELTYVKLQELVAKTRKIIVKMYLDCDKGYKTGIEIYIKMLGSKAVQETEDDLKLLSGEAENTVSESPSVDENKSSDKYEERDDDRYDDKYEERDDDKYSDRVDDRYEEDYEERYEDERENRFDSFDKEMRESRKKKKEEKKLQQEGEDFKEYLRFKEYKRLRKEKKKRDEEREKQNGGKKNKTLKKQKNKKNKTNKTNKSNKN